MNGDLVAFSTPTPIAITLNVIPGGEEDNHLAMIFEANRAAKNKRHTRNEITLVATYPTAPA